MLALGSQASVLGHGVRISRSARGHGDRDGPAVGRSDVGRVGRPREPPRRAAARCSAPSWAPDGRTVARPDRRAIHRGRWDSTVGGHPSGLRVREHEPLGASARRSARAVDRARRRPALRSTRSSGRGSAGMVGAVGRPDPRAHRSRASARRRPAALAFLGVTPTCGSPRRRSATFGSSALRVALPVPSLDVDRRRAAKAT